MGPTDYPEVSVRNYHSTLHNIPEKCRSHMTVWWCKPWLGSTQCSWEWSRTTKPVRHFVCKFKTTSHI